MKQLFITIFILTFFIVTPGFAERADYGSINYIYLKGATKDFKYVEIETSKSTFRVYPCGKIEKLEWTEIHENENILPSVHLHSPYDFSLEGKLEEKVMNKTDMWLYIQ